MKEKKRKLTFRERISITSRGLEILRKYCPGLPAAKIISALLAALQPFAAIWFSARIIDEIASERRIEMLIIYVAAVLGINLAVSILRNITDRIADQKESQMWGFFGKIFSDKQMSMDYADLENAEIQHQRKKAEENLFMFGNGLAQLVWGTTALVNAVVSIIASLSMTITLFTTASGNVIIDNPIWVIVMLLVIVLGGFCSQRATAKENKVFAEWCNASVWFNRTFGFFGKELCHSPERAKDVRIYKQHNVADGELQKLMKHDLKDNRYIFGMSFPPALAAVAVGIGNACCYLFVVLKAFLGAFGVGSIVQYVSAFSRLGAGVQDIMFIYVDNEVYCTHLKSLFEFLDIPNRKYQGTLPVEKRAFCDGGDNDYEIEFKNVSFKYAASDTYALRNISVKLRVGKHIAVVGMNGSGKTTFIKLLCRLYDPTEGEILLNGVNIKKYDYAEYMSIFSVVFQDFKLFSFSLGQNVSSSVDYDRERAAACLNETGFGDRLRSMPRGIDTCLYKDFEDSGVEVSGGEAQKIALARALYKDAPIIVLDEPTAALDPVAEAEIYSKFDEIIGTKTAVYISHRLSSCRFCDDILVFDKGNIVQQGSHDYLVADKSGRYHELWFAQAQYYSENTEN